LGPDADSPYRQVLKKVQDRMAGLVVATSSRNNELAFTASSGTFGARGLLAERSRGFLAELRFLLNLRSIGFRFFPFVLE
jgi:hypothetical protein